MNIGITCYPTYGGSGIVATELGMELSSRGHDVHFITSEVSLILSDGWIIYNNVGLVLRLLVVWDDINRI